MHKPKIISQDGQYRRILTIGDIHGCADHLRRLLDEVKPTGEDLIVTLGDYIDRGPDSKGVIEQLIELHRDPNINIVSLRGNHDALLLMCADRLERGTEYWSTGKCHAESDDETFDMWCRAASQEPPRLWWGNQATMTLASYGKHRDDRNWDGYLEAINEEFYKGLRDVNPAIWEVIADLVTQDHINFLRETCVDALETDHFIFIHGGLCPDLPLADQPLFPLHWARFDKEWKPHASGKKIICGHTPQRDLLIHDLGHAVCLDTGVYMKKGALTCMDILNGQVWQIGEDLQPAKQPIVHYKDGRIPYVRISELPEGDQQAFKKWLIGHNAPLIEEEPNDNCAWPWDYKRWCSWKETGVEPENRQEALDMIDLMVTFGKQQEGEP